MDILINERLVLFSWIGDYMGKVLVDFDVISYRNHLIDLKKQADHEYLRNKGTLTGVSWESMRNAFDIALDSMEDFAAFERVDNQ